MPSRNFDMRKLVMFRLIPLAALLPYFLFPSVPVAGALPAKTQPIIADDDESDDSGEQTGLVAEYRDENGRLLYRTLEPRPLLERTPKSITAQKNSPTSSNTPASVTWEGNLLIRESGDYRFHASVIGSLNVQIADQNVMNSETPNLKFVDGQPQQLNPGELPLRIHYTAAGAGSGMSLQIFWSSDKFTLEPLPADVLFHEADDHESLSRQQRGRMLTDALRCAACHQQNSELAVLSAPDLNQVSSGSDDQTLLRRLLNPADAVAGTAMPHFGFSSAEAASVAAFLKSVSKAPDFRDADQQNTEFRMPQFKSNDVDQGTLLLRSLGCVACHELPQLKLTIDNEQRSADKQNPYAGPSLVDVGSRRSPEWLFVWLQSPETLNAGHRMPKFELSADERRQLTAALKHSNDGSRRVDSTESISVKSGSEMAITEDPEQIQAGRELVVAANCAGCHRIPDIVALKPTRLPVQADRQAVSQVGCLRIDDAAKSDNADSTGQASQISEPIRRVPRFLVTSGQRRDLQAWAATPWTTPAGTAAFDRGNWLLARNGCTACHDRDQSAGLSLSAAQIENSHPDLRGRSQGLIPPALTAVGDKLEDDALRTAVAGRQKSRRLPWLMVRMPQFRHSEQDLSDLVSHLRIADRIPDTADAARPDIAAAADSTPASAEDLLLGNQLAGAGGFNCVACHSAGSFEPRNVALGTRGSDLLAMRERLRPRFFQRWMKNPIRVVSGIEMPAIRRGAPGILNESLHDQLTVLWRAISDRRFTAPTVVSRYEQFVTVGPGERPRIIRDVFTLSEEKQRKSVARALAVGFENGHNALLDLDTMQLRLWTAGEFARQRTEGKSWFWSAAGITIATTAESSPANAGTYELLLSQRADSAAVEAVVDESRTTELIRYQTDETGIDLWYRLHFPTAAGVRTSGADTTTGLPVQSRTTAPQQLDPHSPVTAWNDSDRPVQSFLIHERIAPVFGDEETGWKRTLSLVDAGNDAVIRLRLPVLETAPEFNVIQSVTLGGVPVERPSSEPVSVLLSSQHPLEWTLTTTTRIPSVTRPEVPPIVMTTQAVTSTPGFTGTRLPISAAIMPTAITWLPDGRMAFTSLRGQVWIASDSDGDGVEDQLTLFEEGLAAPFGILADGDSILVSHKPELLRLRDTNGDGRADVREVVAAGWGYSDDYHDWTSGLTRDTEHNLYVGLGSDYSQKDRSPDRDRWRGTVLKIDPSGVPVPIAFAFRYPMGLAFDHQGRMFATDNQGVQNTFNEINHIVRGSWYGVPSRHAAADGMVQETPALQIPHPWTRSVNSIQFLPRNFSAGEFAGHGIGCEYDLRYLIRFTVQEVDGILQGAVYPFSKLNQEAGGSNFIGPICSAISPEGALYIGSIWDSGWQGGPNTGGITRLIADNERPNGIQEVRATAEGFSVAFAAEVSRDQATDPASYAIQAYTRSWGGSYATPDADRHQVSVESAVLQPDGRTVRLTLPETKTGYVYDISVVGPLEQSESLWPAEAHFTLKRIPKADNN